MYSRWPNKSNHDCLILLTENLQNCFVLILATSLFLILCQWFVPSISLALYFLYHLSPMLLDEKNQSSICVPPGFMVQYRREAPGHGQSCQYSMVHLLSRWSLWEKSICINDDYWGNHGVGRSLSKESLLTDYQCMLIARTMDCAGRSVLYRTCIFHT